MFKGKTLIDGLFLALCLIILFPSRENGNCELCPIVLLAPYMISYFMLRVMFSLNYKWTSMILLVVISAICMKELYEGYSQLFMDFGKKKGQEICFGSFSNSGLYGCFLAICSSLFIACSTKTANQYIKGFLIAISVLSLLLLPITMSRASILSFCSAMLLLALSIKESREFMQRNRILLISIFLILGTGAYLIKKPSADGRMHMNKIGLRIIQKNDLKGVGAGSYAGVYGAEQYEYFSEMVGNKAGELDISTIPESRRMAADCPYYAFNEYIKVGVEYGLVAAIILIALVTLSVVISFKSGDYWCYPLFSLSVFAFFSYPFEIKIFPLMLTAFLASVGKTENNRILNVTFYGLMVLLSCHQLCKERSIFDKIDKHSYQDNTDIFISQPNIFVGSDILTGSETIVDQNTLFDYSQIFRIGGDYYRSDSILQLGTKISSDPMFWNVMGNNSLAQGKYREAEERYKHAFYMVPNRLYPLYLLAKLYHTEGDTARFLNMADKVETFIPKVESVNTERLRREIREIRTGYLPQIE